MDKIIRVGLVDDHPVVREGLRVFLNSAPHIQVTVDSASGEDALLQLGAADCDVLLLDLKLGSGMDGVTAFEAIRAERPHIAVLILTSYRDQQSLNYLRSRGAQGYLDKTVQPDDLLEAIRLLAKGRSVWDGGYAPSRARHLEPLTPREDDVLKLLAEGCSNKEIAHRLGIREKTVKVHISHILSKLNVFDRTQAVIVAHQTGLVRIASSPDLSE